MVVCLAFATGHAHADPGALVVVIDRALSDDKLATVTAALVDAKAKFEPGQELAIVSAGKTPKVELALGPIEKAKIPKLSTLAPKTTADLIAALKAAASLLSNTEQQRRILVVTDGDDLIPIGSVAAKLREAKIQVSALGLQSLNRITLQNIARGGKGKLFLVDDAKGVTDAYVEAGRATPTPKDLAVVLVIDRSGSMQGARLEEAKDMARIVVEVLAPTDVVSVVAVDSEALVMVRPQKAANKTRISAEIARIRTAGGTNVFPGLKEAFEIQRSIANAEKHVVLVSDGETAREGLVELATDMNDAGITVSTVGVSGADRGLLADVATAGNGRLFMPDDVVQLAKIFIRP